MRSLCRESLVAVFVTLFLPADRLSALAGQPPPRLSSLQSSDQMSEQEKKLYIQKRLLESYQADDPVTKISLLREILSVDPMNPFAREDMTKAEAELAQKL